MDYMREFYEETDKAFIQIENLFTKDELKEFMVCKYCEIGKYHFGLGTWIRNNILNANDCLYEMLLNKGMAEKDDMSALMISLFYIYIHSKYKPKKQRR